jgi:hypothetical protein
MPRRTNFCLEKKRNLLNSKKHKENENEDEDEKIDVNFEECPICFNVFDHGLNKCIKCNQKICSWCFFKINKKY